MWIPNLFIGGKELIKHILFLLVLLFLGLNLSNNHVIFFLGFFFGWLGLVIYSAATKGIFIRRKSFYLGGELYEIRDFLSVTNRYKNYRDIFCPRTNATLSKIYLIKQPKWAFWDQMRLLIQNAKPSEMKYALLLGGGGGSVAYTLVQTFPSIKRVDVVENSLEMIKIAKKYFTTKPSHKNKIIYYHADGSKFIHKPKVKYDFIFTDMFNGEILATAAKKSKFIINLKKSLNKNGIMISNLGNSSKSNINLARLIKKYEKTFSKISILQWGKNIFVAILTPK